MNDTNDYYLYQGNVYHCSECTTEAEMYGSDCFYGYGKTLLFLDGLGYVDADDCVKAIPRGKKAQLIRDAFALYRATNEGVGEKQNDY